ncbi:MAG: hypothetical protein GF346_13215, partial [Candidatus Eisenbacteria bacterium]|nr:hypothetical protein [Candidatus Latescibacterota bacterium]MBD3303399.1 hypothetical protein [Candidatus Eisenbacteria bacterium]
MASYAYVVKNDTGKEVSGVLACGSMDEAVNQLHAQGFVVLHVTEGIGLGRKPSWLTRFLSKPIGGANTRDLALFTRQLSTAMEAGIPLLRALRGLAADSPNKVLAKAIGDVANRIEKGESLSDAMAAHPEAFTEMYLSMIRAGERAGTLDEILEDLAIYLERIDGIKTKVRSALSYPAFVLV